MKRTINIKIEGIIAQVLMNINLGLHKRHIIIENRMLTMYS